MTISTQDITLQQAAVIGSNLLGFGSGMSAQEQDDVRNTFQLATLVANKLHDRDTQAQAWFGKFTSVLVDTGWLRLTSRYSQRSDVSQSLKVANVLISLVQGAVATATSGTPLAAVLGKLAGDMLTSLPKTGEAFNLFERGSKTDRGAMVGVASCLKTPEGEILLALGMVDLSTARHDYDVLFFDWDSNEVTVNEAAVVLSVNASLITKNRDKIMTALGKRVEDNIQIYLDLLAD